MTSLDRRPGNGRRDLGMSSGTAERQEDAEERVSELLAHRTVEDEVDAVVDEGEYVKQVAEGHVHLRYELRVGDSAEEVENSLRKFRHQKQSDDDEQHARRAVRLPVT